MKVFLKSAVLVLSLSHMVTAAESSKNEDHSHASTSTSNEASPAEKSDVHSMDYANMGHMMGMMDECMKNHKDGKMCKDQVMSECNGKMSKKDCQKMMKEMKNKKK